MLDCRFSACGRRAGTEDLFERYKAKHDREYPDSLYRFCVKAGDRVEKLGWKMGEDKLPRCPECWTARKKQRLPPA
jgi:hypothetical protein